MQFPVDTLNLMMLNAGYAEHYADWNWQGVCSPFTRLYYVTEGEAWLYFQHRRIHLLPGHIYIVPAQTVHTCECHGLFKHYYIHLYEEAQSDTDIFDYYKFPEVGVAVSGNEESVFQTICDIYPDAALSDSNPEIYDNSVRFAEYVKRYNSLPDYVRMHVRGLLFVLFAQVLKYASPKTWTSDRRMAAVLKHIRRNGNVRMEMLELAEIACVSKQHLIRLFRQNFNETPMQYVIRKKIERAELMLLTTAMSVKNVAYALGFNDHSYFIRLFKKHTGKTPAEYRNTRV